MSEEREVKSGAPKVVFEFYRWMKKEGWTEHSSGRYYYKSKDFHQWPPDETASEDELLIKFFGY